MGMITIEVKGSFKPNNSGTFSAMHCGHAQAVANAIEWLAASVMPGAIYNDHRCQQEGVYPENGFSGLKKEVKKDGA